MVCISAQETVLDNTISVESVAQSFISDSCGGRHITLFIVKSTNELIRLLREKYDLPQESPKLRNCLFCGESFMSNGSYDRLCVGCGHPNRTMAGDTTYSIPGLPPDDKDG